MHPLRHPRNAALVGIMFFVTGVILYSVPSIAGLTVPYNEVAAGATMLIFLSVATAILAYVLVAGSSDE
jgi:hypothetical protein